MHTPLWNCHEQEHFPECRQSPSSAFLVVVEVDLDNGVNQGRGRNSKKEFMVSSPPPAFWFGSSRPNTVHKLREVNKAHRKTIESSQADTPRV